MTRLCTPSIPRPARPFWCPGFMRTLSRTALCGFFAMDGVSDAAAFAPAAVAGTFEQLSDLARNGIPSLTHSVIVLWRAGEPRLSEADRDTLWAAFRVPVFEQVIGKSGKRLAAECEAHDGLHVESPALPLEGESVDESPCPCGRKSSAHRGVARRGFRAPHRGLRSLSACGGRQAMRLSYSAKNFFVSRKKISKLVVMQPVAGLIHLDDASICDFLRQRIGFRVLGETLPSPEQQRRTRDLAQNLGGFLQIRAVGRKQARVVIELPDDGPVRVPIGAVQGQMLGHFVG